MEKILELLKRSMLGLSQKHALQLYNGFLKCFLVKTSDADSLLRSVLFRFIGKISISAFQNDNLLTLRTHGSTIIIIIIMKSINFARKKAKYQQFIHARLVWSVQPNLKSQISNFKLQIANCKFPKKRRVITYAPSVYRIPGRVWRCYRFFDQKCSSKKTKLQTFVGGGESGKRGPQ